MSRHLREYREYLRWQGISTTDREVTDAFTRVYDMCVQRGVDIFEYLRWKQHEQAPTPPYEGYFDCDSDAIDFVNRVKADRGIDARVIQTGPREWRIVCDTEPCSHVTAAAPSPQLTRSTAALSCYPMGGTG